MGAVDRCCTTHALRNRYRYDKLRSGAQPRVVLSNCVRSEDQAPCWCKAPASRSEVPSALKLRTSACPCRFGRTVPVIKRPPTCSLLQQQLQLLDRVPLRRQLQGDEEPSHRLDVHGVGCGPAACGGARSTLRGHGTRARAHVRVLLCVSNGCTAARLQEPPWTVPTSGEIPVLVCLCGLPGPMGKACRWLVAISG